ncbi:VOC family protein [Streptomyces lushanensis]|uniref:VOC family protein n=1 Tax=Streptomyces lushanensis TaxID=1434255 RepID=UPI00083077CC|nr:VOC family protein [Streptomyces lushanensis]
MILRIDHIGLATDDPTGVAAFMTALGMRKYEDGLVDDYGVDCEFWQFSGGAGNPAVEIVSPVRENSAIAGRLDREGPGLYHVAFEVDDLEGEMARLRGHGFTSIDAHPCKGARVGMRVAFLYARPPAGLLVELVHYESAQHADGEQNA